MYCYSRQIALAESTDGQQQTFRCISFEGRRFSSSHRFVLLRSHRIKFRTLPSCNLKRPRPRSRIQSRPLHSHPGHCIPPAITDGAKKSSDKSENAVVHHYLQMDVVASETSAQSFSFLFPASLHNKDIKRSHSFAFQAFFHFFIFLG